jgi:hypothetical protein
MKKNVIYLIFLLTVAASIFVKAQDPTRRPTGEEFRRGISFPLAKAPERDVLLVGYAVYASYGLTQYSGSVIIETDALRKDVPVGGDVAQLLNEVIQALAARGELRNVRLDRPAMAYVEILGWTPVRSSGFIYSTRLPAWQEAQTPRQ